jgi:hypothetical protein
MRCVTWAEIAGAARDALARDKQPSVARFVLGQLEEYPRMNGFGGFTHAHFSFFVASPDERDDLTKDGIRRTLRSVIDELKAHLAARDDRGLALAHWEPHVGNIKRPDLDAWAKLTPPEGGIGRICRSRFQPRAYRSSLTSRTNLHIDSS